MDRACRNVECSHVERRGVGVSAGKKVGNYDVEERERVVRN